ncbi:hypothetical protein [Pelotalea chapellei]|uniref:Uncharacterized protein n=1 Tax=Pelotalea chapellei TaxID=44671 RepID=A0ABS5U3T5_9BACT|nr:hypothetical protein [Pelotalea chapellei]MBT1070312.1 hypothetical protein [Pelotalea chapellei]
MITKFKKEVLNLGAEACLPSILSDEWLDYLDQELMALDTEDEPDISCSLAAVVTLLMSKKGSQDKYSATLDCLFDKLIDFRMEIGLEIVHRRTGIKYGPATLKTILTNRTVKIQKIKQDDLQ